MRVLIACEFSGIVRDEFIKKGHDVISCDLLPSEKLGPHYQGNVLGILNEGWDLMIAHLPCTFLAVSGNRWMNHPKYPDREKDREKAIDFFMALVNAPIPRICIENPISIMSTRYRKPDQIIQPWMFGHGETKATCLWLKGLPKLQPTNIVAGRDNRVHREPPGKDRWKKRSRTYSGIADAMSKQWNF